MNTGLTDCSRCGSCCSPVIGMRHIVILTQEDIDRLPSYYRWRHLDPYPGKSELRDTEPYALTRRRRVDGTSACVAFRGSVHGRCKCAIYEHRPGVCRTFGAGHGCEEWLLKMYKMGRPLPEGVDIEQLKVDPP